MKNRILSGRAVSLLAVSVAVGACYSAVPFETESPDVGMISAAISLTGPSHDVSHAAFKVVPDDGSDCDDDPTATIESMLEEEGLPAHLLPEGAGGEHPFADGLFTLLPGRYVVCATPLNENGQPSEECGPVSTLATVVAEATTEVVMISQCEGDPSGALDAVLALNDPPHIDDLNIEPSKFITKCEEAVLTVTATDPDGDDMTFAWEILSGPGDSAIAGVGASAVFTTDSAGDYEVRVTVTDALGASTSLTFPIHVSDFLCEAPTCEERCEEAAEEVLVACLAEGGTEVECVERAREFRVTCIAENCTPSPDDEVLGPVYPPDFPVTEVVPATAGIAATDEGGQDLYFTEFDLSLVQGLGWGNDASQPIVLSLAGSTAHTLAFNAGNSDLPAGVLTWTGTSPFTYWDDGAMDWVMTTVDTRLTLTITAGPVTPIALLDPTVLGLSGQIGGIAPIEENYPGGGPSSPFTVHLLGEAFFGGSWYPANVLFNDYQTPAGVQVIFDFWDGFYYVPLP